jgi:hypothetical protein
VFSLKGGAWDERSKLLNSFRGNFRYSGGGDRFKRYIERSEGEVYKAEKS